MPGAGDPIPIANFTLHDSRHVTTKEQGGELFYRVHCEPAFLSCSRVHRSDATDGRVVRITFAIRPARHRRVREPARGNHVENASVSAGTRAPSAGTELECECREQDTFRACRPHVGVPNTLE
jgi:hypothetical protein